MKNCFCTAACLGLMLLAGCEVTTEPLPTSQPAGQGSAQQGLPGVSHVARGQLRFVDGYQRGLAQAQREGKPVLLFFTAEWCHYCHQMADEAFTNPQVVSLSEKFVCVLVDADASADVCSEFRVSAFPTLQFVSAQGQPLGRMEGKRPGHQVMMAMQAALQTLARHSEPGAGKLR